MDMSKTERWWSDRSLAAAVGVGAVIRIIPVLVWLQWGCARDECTYLGLSRKIVAGEGMVASAGWLWAPGYPMIVSFHRWLTGLGTTTKISQIIAAAVCTVLIYKIASRVWSDLEERESRRVSRIAAWMYALSPHMAFFAISLWSEVLYGTLLLGLLLMLDKSRDLLEKVDGKWIRSAAIVGVMAGCCVLFRGVATYMLPMFAIAFLWRRLGMKRAWQQVAVMITAAMLTVAPYSMYISKKFDAFIVSDRTLGQMMWLGNNDFSPVTFDYGNGYLSKRAYSRHTNQGRKHCASRKAAIRRDTCETEAGKTWILENKVEFVKRMPLRVAQMMNPHSLMTRHLRWGGWRGLPQVVDEGLILLQVLWSMVVMIGGSFALVARGRGSHGVLTGLILLYHVGAIAALAGLTRYRVPLEPLLMIYGAGLISRPRQVWDALVSERWRVWFCCLVMVWVIPLVLWFLPAGWPWWHSW
jgi:hypothetical protein